MPSHVTQLALTDGSEKTGSAVASILNTVSLGSEESRSFAGPSRKRSKVSGEQSHRGPNWTSVEEAELVNAIIPHYVKLFGNFKGSSVTAITKQELWIQITDQVSLYFTIKVIDYPMTCTLFKITVLICITLTVSFYLWF